MHYFYRILYGVLFISTMGQAQALDSFRWKNRLIVFVSEPANPNLNTQKKLFKELENEVADRDILFLERKVNDEELISRFQLEQNFEGVLLIGKDGGLKFSKPFVVQVQTLFELIDSMPMRKAEMRKH